MQTIEAVTKELRNAIFWTMFRTAAAKIDNQPADIDVGEAKAFGFIEFGVSAKLLQPDEGNDWLAAMRGELSFETVYAKYRKE